MRVKSILIWLNEFQFGENKLANFGSKFFNLAKILAKESKTLARALQLSANTVYEVNLMLTLTITYIH